MLLDQSGVNYLIFGGTGSLGKKLIERLIPTSRVAVFSRDEAKHWTIKNELLSGPLAQYIDNLEFVVGDIRDAARVRDVIFKYNPENIIVAAALKQVDTCEFNPYESILTNLIGTQNVVAAASDPHCRSSQHSLRKVLFVSTDKACSPINVYGMCKALSERVISSQKTPAFKGAKDIKFLCVRYGNVLDSRGSIIPLFKHQASNAQHLTVTDPNMTRFVMTLDDSVNLIMTALSCGQTGETWIPKLPAMRIGDLAEIFSELCGKPIKVVGLRAGEKMHEDLINESESLRTSVLRTKDSEYYVVQPAYIAGGIGRVFTYSSNDTVMSKEQLRKHLTALGVIDMPLNQFPGLSIEEIVTNRKD